MVLLNGIDLLKSSIAQKHADPEELELINKLIESVTPDLEDFPGNPLASLALDVSSMIAECFAFVRDEKPRHIELCSAISFSSLELFLQVHEQVPLYSYQKNKGVQDHPHIPDPRCLKKNANHYPLYL